MVKYKLEKERKTMLGNVKDTIRIFGSNNKNIPEAPATLTKLFSVVAEHYMTVPQEYFEDVIRILKSTGYMFKVHELKFYSVIAVQYQKP